MGGLRRKQPIFGNDTIPADDADDTDANPDTDADTDPVDKPGKDLLVRRGCDDCVARTVGEPVMGRRERDVSQHR